MQDYDSILAENEFLKQKLEATLDYYQGLEEAKEKLLLCIRDNQSILQAWNYQFVKDQFYKNAEILKQMED